MNKRKELLDKLVCIPLRGTPYKLFIYKSGLQDFADPGYIVDSGYIEKIGVYYILYCDPKDLKKFLNGRKKRFSKGYGYKYWGEILKQRDKETLFDIMSDFIDGLFNTKTRGKQ